MCFLMLLINVFILLLLNVFFNASVKCVFYSYGCLFVVRAVVMFFPKIRSFLQFFLFIWKGCHLPIPHSMGSRLQMRLPATKSLRSILSTILSENNIFLFTTPKSQLNSHATYKSNIYVFDTLIEVGRKLGKL